MVEEPRLLLQQSRHPIGEMLDHGDPYIPNDFALDRPSPTVGPVAVITGPNGSGKSMLLKQAGLVLVMAHAGCFVPAKRAIIGLTDRLFLRAASSCSTKLRSHDLSGGFARDASLMARVIRHATPRSVVLMDEFGKGTASVDGAAILGACVQEFAQRESPPRVAVATHFREVASHDVLRLDPSIVHFFSMQVAVEDDTVIHPLFRLTVGLATGSHGVACAKAAGMSSSFVERAATLVKQLQSGDLWESKRRRDARIAQVIVTSRTTSGVLGPEQVTELRTLLQ
jgi:DNA mismatch repair ATPase MutS